MAGIPVKERPDNACEVFEMASAEVNRFVTETGSFLEAFATKAEARTLVI